MRVIRFLVILCAVFFSHMMVQAFDLELNVKGVLKKPGKIQVALFDNKAAFDAKDASKAVYTAQQVVQKGTTKIRIKNVKTGRYAIAVLHDENENGKLETGLFGIPKEGVTASNWDGRGRVKFSESVIMINKTTAPLTLHIKYF